MKSLGITVVVSGVLLVIYVLMALSVKNEWDNKIGSYWYLAEKASTIEAKGEYIDQFVEALKNNRLEGYNAIIYKNPNNGYAENMKALETLNVRLKEISKMDISSFAYQQAIQQITAQEQGEAENMIEVFKGVWRLNNHVLFWDWIMATIVFGLVGIIVVGGMIYLAVLIP